MKRLGLALGGGAARGLAHIGVLKALWEAEIPIDCIAGTSMGGIIAAAYATGHTLAEIEETALSLSSVRELIQLIDLNPPRRGLISGAHVQAYLERFFGDQSTFSDTRIPLALTAVDLVEAREVVLAEGPLLPAVLATCAMPGLFPPREMGGMRLIDGGVLNNVPAGLPRQMGAEVVLAVDVQQNPFKEPARPVQLHRPIWGASIPELFFDFYRVELMMIAELTRARLRVDCPDILLEAPLSSEYSMFLGFTRAKEIIDIGYQAGCDLVPRLWELLADKPHK